jgi:hypothetical protein
VEHEERRNGYIADLLVARGEADVAWQLVRTALSEMSREGAGTVMTLAPPGSYLYAILRRFGFRPTRAETSFTFELVPLDPSLSIAELSDPATWHLTGGDFDVI